MRQEVGLEAFLPRSVLWKWVFLTQTMTFLNISTYLWSLNLNKLIENTSCWSGATSQNLTSLLYRNIHSDHSLHQVLIVCICGSGLNTQKLTWHYFSILAWSARARDCCTQQKEREVTDKHKYKHTNKQQQQQWMFGWNRVLKHAAPMWMWILGHMDDCMIQQEHYGSILMFVFIYYFLYLADLINK